jgi:hypothetical protein
VDGASEAAFVKQSAGKAMTDNNKDDDPGGDDRLETPKKSDPALVRWIKSVNLIVVSAGVLIGALLSGSHKICEAYPDLWLCRALEPATREVENPSLWPPDEHVPIDICYNGDCSPEGIKKAADQACKSLDYKGGAKESRTKTINYDASGDHWNNGSWARTTTRGFFIYLKCIKGQLGMSSTTTLLAGRHTGIHSGAGNAVAVHPDTHHIWTPSRALVVDS